KESDSITSEAPAPRLCHLVKWPDFPDYGFNLISQDNGEEIVVNVDPDSPADLAGLKAGDRILEVNGVSVKAAGEVVIQIKASLGEVRLLVLNQVAEQWYRTRGLVPRSTQPNVIYGKTPAVRPSNGAAMNAKNNMELPAKSPAREPADDSKLPDDAPRPRLCQLYKWPDFEGYGFSLHAEQGRDGQYVGKVDPDSPAEFAGLLEGDRIVEVNGASVENEDHRQLVQRIKAMPNKARLLVVNPEGDRWYRERGLKPTSSQPNVIVMETPVPRPTDPTPTVETLHENPVRVPSQAGWPTCILSHNTVIQWGQQQQTGRMEPPTLGSSTRNYANDS
ncbi:SLC9A3R2, partial [Cordylochernes scorpioides]